jgi:hypothetical protein
MTGDREVPDGWGGGGGGGDGVVSGELEHRP